MGSDRFSSNKAIIADTADDETVDFLLKSAMTVPKGQPPKKRTKKYGERKSCKCSSELNRTWPRLELTFLAFFQSGELAISTMTSQSFKGDDKKPRQTQTQRE